MTYALIPIRPVYSDAIMAGTKTVEFRRRWLRDLPDRALIYETAPTSAIVADVRVEMVYTGPPDEAWRRYHWRGGITLRDYYAYFDGAPSATVLSVSVVRNLPRVDVRSMGMTPPQSCRYVPDMAVAVMYDRLSRTGPVPRPPLRFS